MSGDPKLSTMTKVQLGAFALDMAKSNPGQARTIFSLQDTLEKRLPMDLQNEITLKLNKDAKGTLAEAKKLIEKDPKILDEVNKDPTKLATIMGIKVQAPAATVAPTTPATNKPAEVVSAKPPAPPAVSSETPKTEAPAPKAKTEPAAVAAGVAAGRLEASNDPKIKVTPLSDAELALRTQAAAESAKVTQMTGFTEFAARAEKSQSMSQAVDAMMGKKNGSPQDAIAALQDIQKDPEFFVKANKGIDEIPEQMRESVFTQIAEDPEMGRRALAGDPKAKTSLMMGGLGMGGLMGGKGGLGGLFSGEGMQKLTEMLQKILPMLMEALTGVFSKIGQGLSKLTQSTDLMRMGNNPEGTKGFALAAGQALDVPPNQRVVDASKPNDPAITVAQLGGEAPKLGSPGEVRKLEADQLAANADQFRQRPNGPASGPSGS